MRTTGQRILQFAVAACLFFLFAGCAPSLPKRAIVEITDESQCRGCKDLGIVTGDSHWGGLTGQDLSLDVAKKRALHFAAAKGATHILWLDMKKGVTGASVSGRAYASTASNGNSDSATAARAPTPSSAARTRAPVSNVAVMRFETTGDDSGVSAVVTDIFTNQLQADATFKVMERSQISKILSEQGFQNSGACGSAECAVEIGRLLSIDAVFIGSIGRLGQRWVITVRLVSVRTGEILSHATKEVGGKADKLSAAAVQMADQLSRQ
ncbi:MAG TPA: CsgG/HfaB family protein [Chitinivibrionales bacterium]|nr:CsgG/HfaB family protein [Chitinivibrionales bacterium]